MWRFQDFFEGVASKRLVDVEMTGGTSNQHEFNGVEPLKRILGTPEGKTRYLSKVMYFGDDEESIIERFCELVWYDAREKGRKEKQNNRSEWRLYFRPCDVWEQAFPGDLLVFANLNEHAQQALKLDDNTVPRLLVLLIKKNSVYESQICRLLQIDYEKQESKMEVVEYLGAPDVPPWFMYTTFSSLGMQYAPDQCPDALMIEALEYCRGGDLPSTSVMASLAIKSLGSINGRDPDEFLLEGLSRETALFQALEEKIIDEKLNLLTKQRTALMLRNGVLAGNSEEFMAFAMSRFQSRKSRRGASLEHHVNNLLRVNEIVFDTQIKIGNRKVDYLMPNKASYDDENFPDTCLTLLEAKTTSKERWKEIRAAGRLSSFHFLTVDSALNSSVMNAMKQDGIVLVMPKKLQSMLPAVNQPDVMSVKEFLDSVKTKQVKSEALGML